LLFAALSSFTLSSAALKAAPLAGSHILWEIGQADGDDRELALGPSGYADYKQDAVFTVGASDPRKEWPYVLPGPADGWAGGVAHTATIVFAADRVAPTGDCRLTLHFINAHGGRPPVLKITVNGQTWTKPTPAGAESDDSIEGHPEMGHKFDLDLDFPVSLLKVGANTIQIQNGQGAWAIWDAVTMTAPEGVTVGAAPVVTKIVAAAWAPDVLVRGAKGLQQNLSLTTLNTGPERTAQLKVGDAPVQTITLAHGQGSMNVHYPSVDHVVTDQVQLLSQGKPLGEALSAERTPARQYTVYILPHSHTDIGYTDVQPDALAKHQRYLEEGMALASQTAHRTPDARFKWNLEVLYEADEWLKAATPAQTAQFVKSMKSGGIGLDALYANELTGLCRPEELVSYLACANRIREKYKLPIDAAMISDVPGYTWGLVSVMAQSGVKYFSLGPNSGDHTGYAHQWDNEAFYWQGASGKDKVLMWQSPAPYNPPGFEDNDASVKRFMARYHSRFPNSPYDMVYIRYTTGDNAGAEPKLSAFVEDWNKRYAYPHLVISTTSHMFHEFEAKYGSKLKTYSGDYTGYWEDGAASTAQATATNRTAAEEIAQNEILWSMLNPAQYPHHRFTDAWRNALLFDEHTWGAYNSFSDPEADFVKTQWRIKEKFALDAAAQAQTLRTDAVKSVVSQADSNTFAVFNTSSWKRSELVILIAAQSKAGDVVKGDRGMSVPSQRLADGSLAFLASDIPAMSSRKFTVVSGTPASQGSALAGPTTLATATMNLTFDASTGAITRLKTVANGHDFVDASDKTCRGLNDYLYVLGSDNGKVQYASNAKLTVLDNGPLVASIRVDSDAPGGKSLSRVIQVVDGLDEIRIADTIDKLPVYPDEEAVHFGFNFHVPGSTIRMDMPFSVVRPDIDQTPHANKSVYPVGRWVDVSNDTVGVTCATLDSPMMQIGAITLPREAWGDWRKTSQPGSAIYWNVMNNYWHTNYKAYQNGPVTFRYVLRPHGKYDQTAAQQFGIAQSQPLIVAPVSATQPDAKLGLTISNDAVLVTACHPAEDGIGWIVRLYNGSDHAQKVTAGWTGSKNLRMQRTDLFGHSGKSVKGAMALAAMEVVTLHIEP
jgi:alpha-mannosidase